MAKKGEKQLDEVVEPVAPQVLRVMRFLPSPKHVRASDGERDDLVLYVRNAALFAVGMEIPAERVECPDPVLAPKVWRLVGKLPRRRGKW